MNRAGDIPMMFKVVLWLAVPVLCIVMVLKGIDGKMGEAALLLGTADLLLVLAVWLSLRGYVKGISAGRSSPSAE